MSRSNVRQSNRISHIEIAYHISKTGTGASLPLPQYSTPRLRHYHIILQPNAAKTAVAVQC
jgi:hypothetical protein